MKSILIVGAFLMSGAAVYGFVDYSKVKNDKKFRSLYSDGGEETKPDFNIASVGILQLVKGTQEKKAVVKEMKEELPPVKTKAQVKKKKRAVKFKGFSRAELNDQFVPVEIEEGEVK